MYQVLATPSDTDFQIAKYYNFTIPLYSIQMLIQYFAWVDR